MFDDLYNDNITIIKKTTGERFSDIKGSVQNGKKAYYSTEAFIEPGDTLIRHRGDHIEEYIIVEPNFNEGFYDIKSGYQSDIIRKEKFIDSNNIQKVINNINYNLDGNSRINNNSIDNSLNSLNKHDFAKDFREAIEIAKLEIKASSLSLEEQSKSCQLLETVKDQTNSDSDYKSIASMILDKLPSTVKVLPSVVKIIEMLSK